MSKEIPKWDVGDIDPITMFPKDCRYYNGGSIAPAETRKFWRKNIKKIKTKGEGRKLTYENR